MEGDSDKASIEIVSPTTGLVAEILVEEGADFPIGNVIAMIHTVLYEFELPELGECVTEAELVIWSVTFGEVIVPGQVVCEVMTDKATLEIYCPVGGTVVEVCAREGEILGVGACLIKLRL